MVRMENGKSAWKSLVEQHLDLHYIIAQFSKRCSNLAYIFSLSKISNRLRLLLYSITNPSLELKEV